MKIFYSSFTTYLESIMLDNLIIILQAFKINSKKQIIKLWNKDLQRLVDSQNSLYDMCY